MDRTKLLERARDNWAGVPIKEKLEVMRRIYCELRINEYPPELQTRGALSNVLNQAKMSLPGAVWRTDVIPPYDDGRLAVVILKNGVAFEHYEQPIIVSCWSAKLKTTVDPIRLCRSDVAKWKLWEG